MTIPRPLQNAQTVSVFSAMANAIMGGNNKVQTLKNVSNMDAQNKISAIGLTRTAISGTAVMGVCVIKVRQSNIIVLSSLVIFYYFLRPSLEIDLYFTGVE